MRYLPAILSFLVIIAEPSALAAHATPPSWRVVEQRALDIDGYPLTLSPDGAWIAGRDPEWRSFCVWDTETLTPACDGHVPDLSMDTITWAPDSSAVAFSENAPLLLSDSDIYVFEVATGTLHNLTDDGTTEAGMVPPSAEPTNVDLAPSWSPDSQALVFSRTVFGEEIEDPGTALMTIPRSGGEPETILTLAPPYPMAVTSTMSWQEDDTILFSVRKATPADEQNGIWRTSLDGGIDPVMPGADSDEVTFPVIVDAHSDTLSLVSMGAMYELTGMPFWIAGASEPLPLPLDEALALPADTRLFTAPGFSPSGNEIVFVTGPRESPLMLTIGSLESGEVIVTEELEHSIAHDQRLRSIDWAANNTIFVSTSNGGTLITVGR